MKRLVLLFIVIGMGASGYAQTRSGTYNRVVTDQWQTKTDKSVSTTRWRNGTIQVKHNLIMIDSAAADRQVYNIMSRSEISECDYDDGPKVQIQFFTAMYLNKYGAQIIKGYFMLTRNKKIITDVVFRPANHTEITYRFNTD